MPVSLLPDIKEIGIGSAFQNGKTVQVAIESKGNIVAPKLNSSQLL
jgi:hypothetical protein